MKICKSCGLEKHHDEFSKCSARKDGLQAYCRICAKSKRQQWFSENRERAYASAKEWRVDNPDKLKAQQKAIYERNKASKLAGNKEWAKKNPEKRKAIALRHYHKTKSDEKNIRYRAIYAEENRDRRAIKQLMRRRANPDLVRANNAIRRARKRSAPGRYTDADISAIGALQRWKCASCGCGIKDSYHIDHIVPLAKGGSNDRTNLQLLCPTCNMKKNAKDPIEFMQSRGFLL